MKEGKEKTKEKSNTLPATVLKSLAPGQPPPPPPPRACARRIFSSSAPIQRSCFCFDRLALFSFGVGSLVVFTGLSPSARETKATCRRDAWKRQAQHSQSSSADAIAWQVIDSHLAGSHANSGPTAHDDACPIERQWYGSAKLRRHCLRGSGPTRPVGWGENKTTRSDRRRTSGKTVSHF